MYVKMKLNIKADVVSGNQKDFVLIQKLVKAFAKIHVVHAKVSLVGLFKYSYSTLSKTYCTNLSRKNNLLEALIWWIILSF